MSISLEELIKNLPQIIIYFVPGYIFLGIFCLFSSKKIEEVENLFVRSVVISYLFVVIANLTCTLIKLDLEYTVYIALLLSIITSFIGVRIYFSNFYKNFFSKIGKISGHDKIWEDLFERNKGAKIRGCIKYRNQNVEIKGTIKYYEVLDNGDCNIALWNYTIDSPEFGILAKEDQTRLFYIKSCDIEGLEIFQGKDKPKNRINVFLKTKGSLSKK